MMAIHRMILHSNQKPTPQQIAEIEAASHLPDTGDDPDAPELTDTELAKLAILAHQQRERRRKQTISLRLSPETLAKAKSLGNSYTSVLSRIIDYAMDNPDIIRKCL